MATPKIRRDDKGNVHHGDRKRAYRLRKRIEGGADLGDDNVAWLAAYDAEVSSPPAAAGAELEPDAGAPGPELEPGAAELGDAPAPPPPPRMREGKAAKAAAAAGELDPDRAEVVELAADFWIAQLERMERDLALVGEEPMYPASKARPFIARACHELIPPHVKLTAPVKAAVVTSLTTGARWRHRKAIAAAKAKARAAGGGAVDGVSPVDVQRAAAASSAAPPPPAPVKAPRCDGEHAAPACADLECWHRAVREAAIEAPPAPAPRKVPLPLPAGNGVGADGRMLT